MAASYGIGKLKAIATSNKGFLLHTLGVVGIPWDSVENEATRFSGCGRKKKAKSSSAPKLCSFVPTTEAFKQNAKRAHFQCALWYAALDSVPPTLDPKEYGWEVDNNNETLTAISVMEGVCLAPEHVLKRIRCGCSSDSACKKGNGGCTVAKSPVRFFVTVTDSLSTNKPKKLMMKLGVCRIKSGWTFDN